jgi:hypothetical protein
VPWLLVTWPLEWLLPERVLTIDGFVWCPVVFFVWYLRTLNLSLLLFNLLPVFPLDGGRALRALLSMRVHANRATMWVTAIGIAGGAVFVVMGLWQPGLASSIGVVLGVSCITSSLQERQVARHVLIYQQHARDPWEVDGDAWKHGGDPAADAAQPGWLARRRQAKAQQASERAAADAAAFEREVDAALGRVSEVGMTGLTDRERKVLQRASRQRRGTG